MEPDYWIEGWQQGRKGFDQADPHRWLAEYWPALQVADDSTVFVPLCGKSVDMVWLAEQGHSIIGVEVSEIAVDEFFAMVELSPEIEEIGPLALYRAGPYELWRGDLFELPAAVFDRVDVVYDRANIVALPPDIRRRYAQVLTMQLRAEVPWFLVSFTYDQNEMDGPPHSVPLTEIDTLFGEEFEIDTLADESVIERAAAMQERGLTQMRETLSLLRRRV